MKKGITFRIVARDLRPALAALGKVLPKGRGSREAPSVLWVERQDRSLIRIAAGDGQTSLSIDLPGESGKGGAPGQVGSLTMEKARDALRGCRAGDLVELPCSPVVEGENFPEEPDLRGRKIQIEGDSLLALRQALACTSTDPTRQVLQGALLDPEKPKQVRIVGTDGRHLFQSRPMAIPGLQEPIILPAHPVLDSPALRGDEAWELSVGSGGASGDHRCFHLRGSNWRLSGPMVEGNYPKYQPVMPQTSSEATSLNLSEVISEKLRKKLAKIPRRQSKDYPVGFSAEPGTVRAFFRDGDPDHYEEVRTTQKDLSTSRERVFVDSVYLDRALRFGLRQIQIIDETSPLLISGPTGKMVIMPIRVPRKILVTQTTSWDEPDFERNSEKRRSRPRRKAAKTRSRGPSPETRPAPKPSRPRREPVSIQLMRSSIHLGRALFGWLPAR
ncbi:MAG: hypothetical protein AAF491_00695 [Verrucomicrobiota bacterium]